jgi:hypothetical protein
MHTVDKINCIGKNIYDANIFSEATWGKPSTINDDTRSLSKKNER